MNSTRQPATNHRLQTVVVESQRGKTAEFSRGISEASTFGAY